MKTYRAVLVEDNPDDQQLLLEFTNQVPFLTVAAVFDDALSALPFLRTEPVDLLLLDLHMPGFSGFDLLRSLANPPAVILTTASLSDSLEAFDVGAVDYLVKPMRYERFLRAVNRVLSRYMHQEPGTAIQLPAMVTLKQGYRSVRLMVGDITYLEAFGAYTKIHLTDGQLVIVNHMLTDLQEKLLPTGFVRVHRSFIVAVSRVISLSGNHLAIGNQPIPIGRLYKADLRRILEADN